MKFICVPVNGTYRIKLDVSDVEKAGKEKLEPYLIFTGQTYKNIKEYATDPSAFDHIFASPNYFLEQATNEQKVIVMEFFASVNYTIKEHLPKDPREFLAFVENLGQQYYEMSEKVGLLNVFREYAATKITLQDTSDFGTRPQDTEELTFKEADMRETMVIAMFCKLASPIFGELINNLPDNQVEDETRRKMPRYKESRCSNFLTAVLSAYFPNTINKLTGFIHHVVNGICSKQPDPAAIFHGLTIYTRTSIIMSSLFVRNYVLCKLEKPDSNIIRYTDTMVRTLATTQDTNAHKCQVRPRKAPGSMLIGDESGNMAQLEVDSLVSMGTMDGPIIIADSINRVIDKYRMIYQISRSEFEQCLKYFEEHPIYQTPLNKFLASIVFGPEIGGAQGIETVDCEAYTKLIAMLQLIAVSSNYISLAVSLTAAKSTNVRINLNRNEDQFKRQAPTMPHYRACRAQFATDASGEEFYQDLKKNQRELEWDRQLEELLDDMAQTIYITNVPDIILEQVPEDTNQPLSTYIHNGATIEPTVECVEQMCMLISVFSTEEL